MRKCGCTATTNIMGDVEYGTGYISHNGFWEHPCTHPDIAYQRVMDSCLLQIGLKGCHYGTMSLFSIVEEEIDIDTGKVVWAKVLFDIRQFWIFNLLKRKKVIA